MSIRIKKNNNWQQQLPKPRLPIVGTEQAVLTHCRNEEHGITMVLTAIVELCLERVHCLQSPVPHVIVPVDTVFGHVSRITG